MPLVSQTFDQLLDFTRTTSGTFVGSDGLIQTTPASRNLLTWTQQFDNAAWAKTRATVTANATVAPDGTSTADKLVEDTTASSSHFIGQSATYTSGTTYTVSVSVKAAERNWFAFQIPATAMGTARTAYFDVSNGTVGTVTSGITAAIVSTGNGWYRCSVTFTPTASVTATTVYLLATADNSASYTGDGTSGLFVWGAQLEAVPDANLVLGSELVTNPGPFADTTGWTASLGTIAAVSSSLVLTVPVGGSARAVSSAMSGLTIGAAYRISVTGVAGDAVNKNIRITTNADGSTGALFTQSISGTSITYTFVATATTHYLALIVTGGTLNQTFSVSQASVKQITATTGMPSTYTRNNGGVFPPRFDYDPVTLAAKGLLIEEQRTNLLVRSAEFDNASWTKGDATVTANATTSPDGTTNADKLAETTANAPHYALQAATVTATAHTASIFVKAAERTWCILEMAGTPFGCGAWFNLSTGAVGTQFGSPSSVAITAAGNGWWRITMTKTAASAASASIVVYTATGDNVSTYAGTAGSGIFLWGAQLEAGSFATSYIPTVASQVTRTADQCSIVAPNFAPWYNQSEGSWVASFSPYAVAGGVIIQIGAATNADRFQLLNDNASQIAVQTSNVGQGTIDAGTLSAGATNNLAYAYRTNDTAASLNGGAAVADNTVALPVVDRLLIGSTVTPANFLNGHIRSIRYYPTRLTNAQLQALTA